MLTQGITQYRRSFIALAVLVAGAVAGGAGRAQAQAGGGFELRPYVGAYVPTGDQRDLLKDAVLVGAQASWRLTSALAVTGTVGWSPSKDRITAGDQTLDVYQYDIGLEGRLGNGSSTAWSFTPFAGLGIGGRTYNYRDLDVEAKTNVAGYGALGGELGVGRWGLRLEARDYVSRFEPLTGTGETKTRNDVTLVTGITLRF